MAYNIKPNILLTAFCGSSAELLIKDIGNFRQVNNIREVNKLKNTRNYKTLLLPNDKIKDSEKLINVISDKSVDYVISLGQKPNIKNKVHIETTARDGEHNINTAFDCDKLKQVFEQHDIITKISSNAGTSFCNRLYFNCLNYIFQNGLDTKMVFVHIPFTKNISDFDSFRGKLFNVLPDIE